ncbi:MAG: hypothetical protein ACTSSG_02680 [Candidatus Heimdallarchaeaceae archaeon]
MSNASSLQKVYNLHQAALWMLSTLDSFQSGALDRKTTSLLAKKAKKKIERYVPSETEKEHFESVLDLCYSLCTIDRAQGSFEKFYLESLRTELEKITSILESI